MRKFKCQAQVQACLRSLEGRFKTHKTLTTRLVKNGRFILTQFIEQSQLYYYGVVELYFVCPLRGFLWISCQVYPNHKSS